MKPKTTTISILAVGLLAGSAVGVAAQDDEATGPSTPAIVSGIMMGDGEVVQEPVHTMVDGVSQQRGLVIGGRQFKADDPRLTGPIFFAVSADICMVGGTQTILVSNSQRIENEEGSWSSSCDHLFIADGSRDPVACLFSGERAYDGLSAYLVFENPEEPPYPFQGLIFDGDLPPVPELPSAE